MSEIYFIGTHFRELLRESFWNIAHFQLWFHFLSVFEVAFCMHTEIVLCFLWLWGQYNSIDVGRISYM